MRTHQSGFTLIEMMIVVAIIGILASIAIPAYQNYTIRAQVTEGLNLSGGWKTAIVEYYANTGGWPTQTTDLGGATPSTGNYVTSITVNNGAIVIQYGAAANNSISGQYLTLVPFTNSNDDILWQCGLAAPPSGNPASGATNQTTLAPQMLPAPCRS